jgi:hypothetical protein
MFFHFLPLLGCFPFLPESLRAIAKKVTGTTAVCVSAVRYNAPTERSGYSWGELFRCERGDDFFEARIAAERVPVGMEFE